jgi:hypothetical protein
MLSHHLDDTLDPLRIFRTNADTACGSDVNAGSVPSALAHHTGQNHQFVFHGTKDGQVGQEESIYNVFDRPCYELISARETQYTAINLPKSGLVS